MAVNDIIDVNFQGTFCGVPFAFGMAYKQVEADAAGESPGLSLVQQWLSQDPGPWQHIRTFLSTQFNIECVVASWGTSSETLFIQDGEGLNATPSWPSTMSVQINTPSADPHPGSDEGRFYLNGFTWNNVDQGVISNNLHNNLRTFNNLLLNIDNRDAAFRFKLYPHAKYLDRNGGVDVLASLPFHNPFIKNLGNRRASQCVAFVAQGAGGSIVVPPVIP